MQSSSVLGLIAYGLWIALLISLPILAIIIIGRAIRGRVTPHQKEMQGLLIRAVELLEENNRLLRQLVAGKRPDEKLEKTG